MAERSLQAVQVTSKTESVLRQLTELAKQRGPNQRMPKVADLCSELGVSWGTIDRALAELERRGILERQHGKGIFVSQRVGRTTVGVALGLNPMAEGTSPYYGLLLKAAEETARKRDWDFSVYLELPYPGATPPLRERLAEDLESESLSGVLLLPTAANHYAWIARQGVPIVVGQTDIPGTAGVTIDTDLIAKAGVEALAKAGCKRIALIGARSSITAFSEALEEAGLEYDPRLAPALPERETSMEQRGFAGAQMLFEDKANAPDGLLVLDDVLTRGALAAMAQANVNVPDDCKVASHTNKGSSVLTAYEPRLICLEVDPAEMISLMYEKLAAQLKGEEPDPLMTYLGCKVVEPSAD